MVIMSRYSGLGTLATPRRHTNYTLTTPSYDPYVPVEKTARKDQTSYEAPLES